MFEKHCDRQHKHMGIMGLALLSTAMTLPLIYYAMDIAHSLRSIAQNENDVP
ncbi:Hypothetical protein LUCI_0278 [Lucifera butyrica]|uniref:Uncharacterized protein n=1 Tax=Lucifera butyrica TaxID=1351585 RepID=A0A498R477_9FIRM|nr:hypothetical protein [Lucifera butyrica]VBB05072.1 Hypothetical protein LUCI_0278 [Lucifera butyrica]